MAKWVALLLLLGLLSAPRTAHAQATVGALGLAVDQLKSAINDAIGSAGAQGRSVVLEATSALDGAMQQLRQLVNNDLSRQISNLTGAAQLLAERIKNTTRELDDLVRIRMACGVQGVEYLLAAVKTIVGGLQNAIPLIKHQSPFLYGFQFDGHSPGVIPREGGRATIKGFGLWNQGLTPTVRLVDNNRAVLHQMAAQRGADDNVVSTLFWENLMHSEIGKCDAIEVTVYKKQGILRRIVPKATMYLPICFPQTLAASFKVTAHTKFECRNNGPETKLQEDVWDCKNTSCEQQTQCHIERTWPVGDGCEVLRIDQHPGGLNRGSTSVAISHQGAKVIANGTIDTADCVNAGFVHHLDHPTEWQMVVAPVIRCVQNKWTDFLIATSNPLPVTSDTLPACVEVPRPCDPLQSTAALEISVSYGGSPFMSLMTTPFVTVQGHTQHETPNITYQGMMLEGTFNPFAGDRAQACATLHVPSCGY